MREAVVRATVVRVVAAVAAVRETTYRVVTAIRARAAVVVREVRGKVTAAGLHAAQDMYHKCVGILSSRPIGHNALTWMRSS